MFLLWKWLGQNIPKAGGPIASLIFFPLPNTHPCKVDKFKLKLRESEEFNLKSSGSHRQGSTFAGSPLGGPSGLIDFFFCVFYTQPKP